MKLPFIKYLESLVMCRYNNEKIKEELGKLPIPLAKEFPEDAINVVRQHLMTTDVDYFTKPDVTNYPDMDNLKALEVFDMVHYILKLDPGYHLKHISGAIDLVNDQDMFNKISSLALSNISDEEIELIVHGKYNIHYDETQIKAFLFYFFNVSGWILKDKKEYIALIKDDDLLTFYEMAIEGDKSYLMWKLGIAPQKTFEVMLQDMGSDAYYFFKEKSKRFPSEAQTWAGIFLRAIERAEKLQLDKDKSGDFFKDLGDLLSRANKGEIKIKESIDTPPLLPHIEALNKG